MSFRSVPIALLSLIVLVALVACGDSNPTPTPEPVAAESSAEVAETETEAVVEEEQETEPTATPVPAEPTITEIAVNDNQFATLVAALQATGLANTLEGEGPFTVFAPTDEAFAALPEGTLDALLANPESLEDILLYHVVPGEVMAADVLELESAMTVQGEEIAISVEDGTVMVNDATVVATDVEAANGVIHVIDSVILPPSIHAESTEMMEGSIVEVAADAGSFGTLLAAAEAAGLVETLEGEGPYTVFAPTDEAFAGLAEGTLEALLANPEVLSEILLYHVVPGEVMAAEIVALNSAVTVAGYPVAVSVDGDEVMVNDAAVLATDVQAANGVIHIIDRVLLPPENDLVETAASDESFSTLVTAIEAAGLTETLQGAESLTVFAPTNDAFAALPEGALESLLEDPDALRNVLLYHVVEGAVFSGAARDLEAATTLQGSELTIRVDESGNLLVNDARVVVADIISTNGVIHVIDAVITPPSSE